MKLNINNRMVKKIHEWTLMCFIIFLVVAFFYGLANLMIDDKHNDYAKRVCLHVNQTTKEKDRACFKADWIGDDGELSDIVKVYTPSGTERWVYIGYATVGEYAVMFVDKENKRTK